MLRGILAALVGTVLFVLITYFLIALMVPEYGGFKFMKNVSEKYAEVNTAIIIAYPVINGTLVGIVTRAMSRGGFFWSFLPLSLACVCIVIFAQPGSSSYVFMVILFMLVLITPFILLGWWIVKRKQRPVISRQTLESNKHLI